MSLLRASYARGHIASHAANAAAWDAFADHHGLDPTAPTDAQLVAFVEARARAGIAWSTLNATLGTLRLAVEHTSRLHPGSVTIPAHRHLADLHAAGVFDPAAQAPLATLGDVAAIADAAGHHDHALTAARDQLLVTVTYLAALRPDEWTHPDLDHLEVNRGRLTLLLPHTKTGRWHKVTVGAHPGLDDPAELARRYLELRGGQPGPLLTDPDDARTSIATVLYALQRGSNRSRRALWESAPRNVGARSPARLGGWQVAAGRATVAVVRAAGGTERLRTRTWRGRCPHPRTRPSQKDLSPPWQDRGRAHR